MKAPGVIVMIGKAKITAGVLAAVAVLAAGCGSSTTGQDTQQEPAPAQSTTQPQATQPAYDTAGYVTLSTNGPEAVALWKEEDSLTSALEANNMTAARREARHVIRAAGPFLAALRATNPEPEYQGTKEHDIRAVIQSRNAGRDIIAAIRDSDPAKWNEAADHLGASAHQAKHVIEELQRLEAGG